MLRGVQLRRLREAAGVSPDEAAYEIRASRSKISRMENGRAAFKIRGVEDLLTLYGVTSRQQRSEVLLLARPGPPRIWAVMDEAVLRRLHGGAVVMRAQLRTGTGKARK
jgi:transcriptional regulator with XRE-family HTH domain